MLSSKFIITLVGLLAALFAICNMNFQESTVEGFWGGPGRRWKTIESVHRPGCAPQATRGNLIGGLNDDSFIKTPAFQSLLAPRFDNTGMTPDIRHSPPAERHMASRPCDPLSMGNMAQENYSSNGVNESNSYAQSLHAQEPANVLSALPVGNMASINAEGVGTNPVVYNNFVFANQKSKLRQHGDPIRGDLPIVPCKSGWFSVHPNVNLDLQAGALATMGGVGNQTALATAQLIRAASGGIDTPTAGDPNLFSQMSMLPQYTGLSSAASADIQVSGMP